MVPDVRRAGSRRHPRLIVGNRQADPPDYTAVGDWRTIRLMGMLEVEAIHEETQRALVEAFRGWRPSAPCVQGERPRRWLAREPKGSESLAEQCGNGSSSGNSYFAV